MSDNQAKTKAQPKPTDPLMQVCAALAYSKHKNLSDDQLRAQGYAVSDEIPGWKLNQELVALEARKLYQNMSNGTVRWIAGSAFSGIPRNGDESQGISRVKVVPHVLVVGGEPMTNGRAKVHFRAKPNPNARGAKDGSEHAQTAFMNTAEGQVVGALARACKGKIVTAIIEMEPMVGRSETVRTLRDLTNVRDLTRADMERLEISEDWLTQRGIALPQQ